MYSVDDRSPVFTLEIDATHLKMIWKAKKRSKNRIYARYNQNNWLNEAKSLVELKWVIILSGTVDPFTTITQSFDQTSLHFLMI